MLLLSYVCQVLRRRYSCYIQDWSHSSHGWVPLVPWNTRGTLHFRRNKAVAALELGTVVPVDQSTVDALGTAGLVVLVELRTVVPVEPAQRSYYYNTDSTT